jgi:microcin C transport system permease protein
MRLLGIALVLFAILSGVGEVLAIELPTVRWPFAMSRSFEWLRYDSFLWFGWVFALLMGLAGAYLLVKFWGAHAWTPIMERRIRRFKSIKRGYYSLLLIVGLAGVASLDHVIVGNEALAVRYDGNWTFPAFSRGIEKGEDYGVTGDLEEAGADYRLLQRNFEDEESENVVVMPLIPYAPTGDSIAAVASPLSEDEGVVTAGGKRFSGLGSNVYDRRTPERQHLRFSFRNGIKEGPADGWDGEGTPVYTVEYKDGKPVPGTDRWNGAGELEDFLAIESSELMRVRFNPSPPTLTEGSRHFLGTTPQGYDVLAYLYGGLQVNFKAALLYIPVVYMIGISMGLLMGYFGGLFDLAVQRVIEILSNIPFLFVVMIASTSVPDQVKDKAGLGVILVLLAALGWMGMTYLMRTAALKEKARDYIAASRVIGASTPRILYRHLLPNSVAILVTLIPFSVSSLVLSLTSLDYLGFGLPEKYASWGKLLKFGLEQLSSPWLVTTAFMSLVLLLVLVTFVGEAVREAFDPKKYTIYR